MGSRITVVMPVYNEEECIEQVVNEWYNTLLFMKLNFKILIINDGSTDNSRAILNNISANNSKVEVINQANAGHGQSLLRAYKMAISQKSDWIFQVDSDQQIGACDFKKLWDLRNTSQFILGKRTKRKDDLSRLVITRILCTSIFMFFQTYIKDSNIPFRLMHTSCLKRLLSILPQNLFAPNVFLSILAKKYGENIQEVPVNHFARSTGSISIVQLNLIKACVKSFFQLLHFRKNLSSKLKSIQHSEKVYNINYEKKG